MVADTFIGRQFQAFTGMPDEKKLTVKDLAKVMLQNFLFTFLSASALGFTGASIGVFAPQADLYTFTLAFSVFWGCAGAAAAWSRRSENVKMPQILRQILRFLGADAGRRKQLGKFFYNLALRAWERMFIPFVHSPRCYHK